MMFFQLSYLGLNIQGLDYWRCVELAPRLVHALLSSTTDLCTWQLAYLVFDHSTRIANYALFCQLVSWFLFFTAGRPFANGLEATLVTGGVLAWTTALHHWRRGGYAAFPAGWFGVCGILAGVSVASRPNAVVVWVYVALSGVASLGWGRALRAALAGVLPGAVLGVAVGAAADRAFYGRWTCTACNFIRFNVVQGLDAYYGAYPWHWYAINGVPAVAASLLPLLVYGLIAAKGPGQRQLAGLAAFYLIALSCTAHKEHRFLLPVAPLMSIYAGRGLLQLESAVTGAAKKERSSGDRCSWLLQSLPTTIQAKLVPGVIAAMIVINSCAGLFINLGHQRGPVAAAEHIADVAQSAFAQLVEPRAAPPIKLEVTNSSQIKVLPLGALMSAHFLGGCHFAPFYSVVHAPIAMLQLDCSPLSRLAPPPGEHCHQVKANDVAVDVSSPPSSGLNFCVQYDRLPTEHDAWATDPARFLQSMYGLESDTDGTWTVLGEAPLICQYGPFVSSAPPTTEVTRLQAFSILFPAVSSTAESGAINFPDENTFATMAAAFLAHFGPTNLTVHPKHSDYRQLPTHIVITDGDASVTGVRAFLQAANYTPVASYFNAFGSTDVHSKHDRGAGRILVFEHTCWQQVRLNKRRN
jgi:phosphatidylinositol glycan class B